MKSWSKINKELLQLSIPNIFSNISVPLLGSVDTVLMGHLSPAHLGAVGVGGMLFSFLYWNFGFLRMGTTGITAQAFGNQDAQAQIHALVRALLLGLTIGLILILLKTPLAQIGFELLNTPERNLDLALRYFDIRIWAAPASLGLYVVLGWFFGMQNSIYPLIITICINVANILLSLFFVNYLGWSVEGVAWGTLIAQYVGLLLALCLFYIKYKDHLNFIFAEQLWEVDQFKRFFIVNQNIFIRTVALTLAFGFFYNQSGAFDHLILEVNVVLLQFLNWMSYGIDGFGFAAESLTGKYYGARQKSNFQRALYLSFIWGAVLAILYALVYGFFGRQLLQLFSDSEALVGLAEDYLIWMIVLPIAGFASYIWDGVFVGLTAAKSMRNSMLVAFAAYLLVYYLWAYEYENHGLWLSLVCFLIFRAIFQHILYWRKGWEIQ